MRFKIIKAYNTIPMVVLNRDENYPLYIVNKNTAHCKDVPYAVSLVPFYTAIIPISDVDAQPTGFYDQDGNLDCSDFEATDSSDLISKISKFFTIPGGSLMPTQKSWFSKTSFSNLITRFFADEVEVDSVTSALLNGLRFEELGDEEE